MQPRFLHNPAELVLPEEETHSNSTSSLKARPTLRHHLSNPTLSQKFSFLSAKPSERDSGGMGDSNESRDGDFMAGTSFHSGRDTESTRNSRTSSWRRFIRSREALADVDYRERIHVSNGLEDDGDVSGRLRAPRPPTKKSQSLLNLHAKFTTHLDDTFQDHVLPPHQSLRFRTRVINLFTVRDTPKLPLPVPSIMVTPTLESVNDGSSYSGDSYSRLERESSCSEGRVSPRSSIYGEPEVPEVSEDDKSMWWW